MPAITSISVGTRPPSYGQLTPATVRQTPMSMYMSKPLCKVASGPSFHCTAVSTESPMPVTGGWGDPVAAAASASTARPAVTTAETMPRRTARQYLAARPFPGLLSSQAERTTRPVPAVGARERHDQRAERDVLRAHGGGGWTAR